MYDKNYSGTGPFGPSSSAVGGISYATTVYVKIYGEMTCLVEVCALRLLFSTLNLFGSK